jgi:hypothetical protein
MAMEEFAVTWKRATIIWWSLFWRWVLFSVLAGFIAGFVLGLVLAAFGKVEDAEVYGQIAGVIVGIPVGIWVVKKVLVKEFGRFRIALVPSSYALLEKSVNEKA